MPDSPQSALPLRVVDMPEVSRFELLLDGERIGWANYSLRDDVLTVPHVETDRAHRGQGFAAALMDGVIESIRSNGQRIRPVCAYATAYMRRRPELASLTASGSSEQANS